MLRRYVGDIIEDRARNAESGPDIEQRAWL